MIDVIIGNICSIGATISDSISGTRRTEKGMLLVQCVSQVFYAASAIVLKGYSAAVQNVVTVFRNTYAVYGKKNKVIQWFLIILPVVLGLIFNNRGWLGIIPVVANLQYSLTMMFGGSDAKKLKYSMVIVCVLFSVFNFAILNFVAGISCIVTVIVTVIAIIKDKSRTEEEAE